MTGLDDSTHETQDATSNKPCLLEVAIVGGGIIGILTGLGLVRRGIRVKIYERAPSWHEVGAGFGFTAIARQCMQRLDPAILETFGRIAQKTTSNEDTRYWDAFHARTKREAEQEASSLLFQLPLHRLSFWGAVRSQLLLTLADLLPAGVVEFEKRLIDYRDDPASDRVALRFADGSTADAHVLIGCDGVHSTTRELLLGPDSRPGFSHTVAYRTMIPMASAIQALGEDKAMSVCMNCAPDVNIMCYPVANATLLNIALFARDDADFPDPDIMTAPTTRDELRRVVAGLSPPVRELAELFPPKMVKWGIFDTHDRPAPTYARGLVCVVGDAAHASAPHQGAGACMGVEDALVLCEVLDVVVQNQRLAGESTGGRRSAVERALGAYSDARRGRSQWLVRSSREMGDMYQWRHGPTGRDPGRMRGKLEGASRVLGGLDVEGMVEGAREGAGDGAGACGFT